MLSELKLINLPSNTPIKDIFQGDVFIVKTCQRTMILGFNFIPSLMVDSKCSNYDVLLGAKAYKYLLETICGLKSRILGENEIVGQFKQAYCDFLKLPHHNPHIMPILEKLFKDAKEVRTQYLLEIGQLSYAGITRKLLMSKAPKGSEVLILGSGQLAEDTIKLLGKHFQVVLSARNTEKRDLLISSHPQYNIKILEWNNLQKYTNHSFIVNTIGTDTVLFPHSFFMDWSKKGKSLFVDLGSPSVLQTSFGINQSVVRLEDIFNYSKSFDEEKTKKVTSAKEAIINLVEKRKVSFTLNFPFGWEELQFA